VNSISATQDENKFNNIYKNYIEMREEINKLGQRLLTAT
jgi:hypothetical protein